MSWQLFERTSLKFELITAERYAVRCDGDWVDVAYFVVGRKPTVTSKCFATSAAAEQYAAEACDKARAKGYSRCSGDGPSEEVVVAARLRASPERRRDAALRRAVADGNDRRIRELLDEGADPMSRGASENDEPAFLVAASRAWIRGDVALIRPFLGRVPIDARGLRGQTALCLVAGVPRGGIVQGGALRAQEREGSPVAFALLDAGADAALVDSEDQGPLHAWASSGVPNAELVDALLRAGARVDQPDHEGATPLHHAADPAFGEPSGWALRRVELLMARGASAAARDKRGGTPLDRAIERGASLAAAMRRKS